LLVIAYSYSIKGQAMKSVTEFWNVTLIKGIKAKEALVASGKTPEEIQASIGETFKMEGDKLKHFTAAMDVAAQNLEKLQRVLVVSLAEGENAPQKATKVEEHYYIPDFIKENKPVEDKNAKGGKGGRPGRGGRGGGGRKDGPKPSPWGLSPEEKAAKKAGAASSSKKA
jgi:hypothetical protein